MTQVESARYDRARCLPLKSSRRERQSPSFPGERTGCRPANEVALTVLVQHGSSRPGSQSLRECTVGTLLRTPRKGPAARIHPTTTPRWTSHASCAEENEEQGRPITAARPAWPAFFAFSVNYDDCCCSRRKRNQHPRPRRQTTRAYRLAVLLPAGAARTPRRERNKEQRQRRNIPGRQCVTSHAIHGHSRQSARHWALTTSGARSGPMAGRSASSLPYMAILCSGLNAANARAIKRPPAAFSHRSRVPGFAWSQRA